MASPAALLEINEINNVVWRTPLTELADAKGLLGGLENRGSLGIRAYRAVRGWHRKLTRRDPQKLQR
jgi:hypothetical protein